MVSRHKPHPGSLQPNAGLKCRLRYCLQYAGLWPSQTGNHYTVPVFLDHTAHRQAQRFALPGNLLGAACYKVLVQTLQNWRHYDFLYRQIQG